MTQRLTCLLCILAFPACTYTEASHPSGASLTSWRILTQTGASLESQEFRASYSSDPQAQQTDALMRALLEVAIGRRLEARE